MFYINCDDLTYNNPNGVFSPWRKSYILHEMGRNCPSLQLLQSTEIPAKNLVCLSRSQRPSMLKFPTMSHAVVTSQIYLSSNIEDAFLSNVAINNVHNTTYLHTIFLMALVTKSTSASTFVMRSPFSADCHAISNGYLTLQNI